MKTYSISTRYSTITIELSFYVLLYVYNCNIIINRSEKNAKKHGRSTRDYLRGSIPPEGVFLNYRCYSSTFLHMQHFFTEIYADPILDELGCHGEKNKMATVDLTHTFNIINYITKYYVFSSENNFTLKCNVKPNVLKFTFTFKLHCANIYMLAAICIQSLTLNTMIIPLILVGSR